MYGNLPPFGAGQHLGSALLRTESVGRPAVAGSGKRAEVRFGPCEVRIGCREVLVNGQIRPMQPLPFNLLVYLIEHRSRVMTIAELLDALWGDACVQPGALPAAVVRVRKALSCQEFRPEDVVRTYPRVGYRFVASVDSEPSEASKASS